MSKPSQSGKEPVLPAKTTASASAAPVRINSQDLFRQGREVEIDHQGKLYRLRLTQSNKLILTA
jgi:hemin uptake protein HemP